MAHAGIQAGGHVRAHPLEHCRALFHACPGHVGVDITTAKKHRRAPERAWIAPGRPWGTNQAAAEDNQAAITVGVARRKFGAETRALRKTETDDPVLADRWRAHI